jgi:uncharacterized metal-binding protein
MSCIAGVGGNVPHLVKIAHSGRPIIALDGCPLACTKACLTQHDIEPDSYHLLNQYGVKKIYHTGFDSDTAQAVLELVIAKMDEELPSLPSTPCSQNPSD